MKEGEYTLVQALTQVRTILSLLGFPSGLMAVGPITQDELDQAFEMFVKWEKALVREVQERMEWGDPDDEEEV